MGSLARGPLAAVRVVGLAWLVGAMGCGDLFHPTDWPTRCAADPAADGCGAGATTSSGAGGGGGTTTSSSSSTSTGAGGGDGGAGGTAAPVCGNGLIEAGEECDGGAGAAGCTDSCKLDCIGADEHEDSATFTCYRWVTLAQPWGVARDDCVAWGGYLVSIGSAAEQQLFGAFVTDDAWIGASDLAIEGAFGWESGEPFVFTAWAAGEPNDSAANEDCAEMRPILMMQWNDLDCASPLGYLCERPRPGTVE